MSAPNGGIRLYPPSSSLILVDSKFRTSLNESPTSFQAKLNGGITGKTMQYKGFQWTQPFFTHSNHNNEILFTFLNETLVTWVRPWVTYRLYDGHEDNPASTGPFNPAPTPDSYCAALTAALNDFRYIATPFTKAVFPPLTFPTFTVQYSRSTGFRIVMDMTGNIPSPTPMGFLPCSFFARGYNIHGLSVLNETFSSTGNALLQYLPPPLLQPIVAAQAYFFYSNSPPLLLPTRFVTVFSPELTKDKRLASLGPLDGPPLTNEIGVFPMASVKTSNVLQVRTATEDATTWSLRKGYEPQYLSISMVNGETGDSLVSDNNMFNFLSSPLVPTTIKENASSFVYTTETTNWMVWGTNAPPSNSTDIVPSKASWGAENAVCIPDEIIHLFQAFN